MVEEGVDVSPNGDKGVLKRIIKEGEGTDLPSAGCLVKVHYTGTLLDGTKFDSSKDRNEPFEFNLGKESVIKAWDIGVATMKMGEVCVLTCAPEYAYGPSGSPPKIPPNSTLKFEIEMLGWKGEDLSPKKNNGIVRYTITPGTGIDHPNDGALVEVDLEGRLSGAKDAKPFETRSVTFHLGEGSEVGVCDGIERALEKFSKGEKSRLVIQPKYAFKAEGNKELGVPGNAVVEYTVTLKSFEASKESWSMDDEERIEQAKIFKEKGTDYFKAGKHQLAIKMYLKVNALIKDITSDGDGEGDNKLSATSTRDIKLTTNLNLALCYLKLNPPHHLEVRDHATNALEIDPTNVKGLFRKGQALLGLGEATQATDYFQMVLELEPENKAASNQIVICNATMKKQKEKEKQLYANMFEKFADRDRETERLAAKDRPDVMSQKLGEWGVGGETEWTDQHRNRAPTEFERENPNILMLDKDGQFENM